MAIISGDLNPLNLNDVLKGTVVNNTFIGGLGSDTIDGGGGQNLVDYSALTTPITFDIGTNVVTKTATTQDILSNVQTVRATTVAGSTLDGSGLSIPDGLTVNLATSSLSYKTSTGVTMTMGVENFTNVIGSSRNDWITGNVANNNFIASLGVDNYVGGGGSNVLDYTQLPATGLNSPPTRISYKLGENKIIKQGIGEDIFSEVQTIVAPDKALTLQEQQQLKAGGPAGSILDLSGSRSSVTFNSNTGDLIGGVTFGFGATNAYKNFDSIVGTGFADTFIVNGSRDVSLTLGGTTGGVVDQINIANPGQGNLIITDFQEGYTLINMKAQPGFTAPIQLTLRYDPILNNTTFSLPTGQDAFTLLGINFDQALNVISNEIFVHP